MRITLLSLVLACSANCPEPQIQAEPTTGDELHNPLDAPDALTVTSTSFDAGGSIDNTYVFAGFGCAGENRSPALAWSGAPEGTQSFAVVAHDPDAPTGVGFFHWLVFNVPADVTSLAEGELPVGAQTGHTDFGQTGYGGPCPPPGTPHRYIFTVYALDVPALELGENVTGALLRFQLRGHTLGYGRITGTYER